MNHAKHFLVFCIVLALCCSSAFSVATLKGFSTKSSAGQQEVTPATESTKASSKSTETTLDSQSSLTSSEVKAMTREELEEMLIGKHWLTDDAKDEIVKTNQKLGEDIEDLKKLLKKEQTGTKFFADFGLAFGFGEGIQFGGVADIGMRFGKGWMFKVGGQYMVGDMDEVSNILNHDFSISNATVQATIGFEW